MAASELHHLLGGGYVATSLSGPHEEEIRMGVSNGSQAGMDCHLTAKMSPQEAHRLGERLIALSIDALDLA